jgi:exonuclease VII large subunit
MTTVCSSFSLRAAFVGLALAFVAGIAQARPAATPEDVYGAYADRVQAQIEAAEAKLDSQYVKADQAVQRLLDREAPEATIARAINGAINGVSRTIRTTTAGLTKTALAAKRTLTRQQAAAERREDFDTATQAEAFIAEIDQDIDDYAAAADEAISSLQESLQAVSGSEELALDYAMISDEFFAGIEDYVSTLLDNAAIVDEEEVTED